MTRTVALYGDRRKYDVQCKREITLAHAAERSDRTAGAKLREEKTRRERRPLAHATRAQKRAGRHGTSAWRGPMGTDNVERRPPPRSGGVRGA